MMRVLRKNYTYTICCLNIRNSNVHTSREEVFILENTIQNSREGAETMHVIAKPQQKYQNCNLKYPYGVCTCFIFGIFCIVPFNI